MSAEKMIQRCQLSSAANLFLNSHDEYNYDEPLPMNHPTAPYYDGHNWKSAESVAKELERHKESAFDEYWRIREQMEDSLQRIELGYKNAKRADRKRKAKKIVKRGSARAVSYPAHLQTPFILNPTPNRVSPWPSRFENSHLSEHTGRLGLPVNHDHEDMNQGGLHLEFIRASADSSGRKDQQYSPRLYHDHILEYSNNSNSPGVNKPLLESVALFLFENLPQTMKRIHHEITKGTDDEKRMKAEIKLSKLKNIFRRNQLKRKRIKTANKSAAKAQKIANHYIAFKKSADLEEQIEQFEYIKNRGEGYLEVNHHLSAVPGYMGHELSNERLQGTGLWNGMGPGNGVKRKRMGSVWRNRDPYGFHSSLRMVSNASSDFQEEYVTKATYHPPTWIHTVDGRAERMAEEPIPEDIDPDQIYSDETSSDQTSPVDISSDQTSLEKDSDEWVTEEDETIEDEQDEIKNGDE
ncbi:hypothetical protein BTUL_0244g00110 [Botrytis tulipae]|uniref:Uncharacterized protein n=1 Tax=Botrytis tulipae TaxID=87230 RepID=A0A4Z1E6Q4_9HELO|nr:hypothetical protein BTUL_0244g00110 [Botrytis tulipae]